MIGYDDIQTHSAAYFYVQRQSSYAITGTTIPYEFAQLNIGGAMNISNGVFTAPTSGRYFFSVNARANADGTSVLLRLNKIAISASSASISFGNMPISATLNLNPGDQVDLWLSSGSIFDDASHKTMFSGMLLAASDDFKSSSDVYFNVQRQSNYDTINSVVPYEVTQLNIGGAMNISSGVFTAPTSGRYFFSFNAVSASNTAKNDFGYRSLNNSPFLQMPL